MVGAVTDEDGDEDKEFTIDQGKTRTTQNAFSIPTHSPHFTTPSTKVERLRHVLITKRRAAYLEEMQEVILGDTIIDANSLDNLKIPQSINIGEKIQAQIDIANVFPSLGEKFDRLFALTLTLKHFDHLLQETQDVAKAQSSLDVLGETWKLLLPESDTSLEIDSDITRKGISSFLSAFADSVKNFKFAFIYCPPSSSGAAGL